MNEHISKVYFVLGKKNCAYFLDFNSQILLYHVLLFKVLFLHFLTGPTVNIVENDIDI